MRTEAHARRKFSLLDAMTLVVAAALSLFWLRERSRMNLKETFYGTGPSSFFLSVMAVRPWFNVVVLILVPLTFASIVFRIRQPRQSLRRVMCQPGAVACLMTSMVFAFYFARKVAERAAVMPFLEEGITLRMYDNWEYVYCQLGNSAAFAGEAVIGAWLTLALGHRWRPEASWVDRFGRFLGMAWIATVPIQVAFEILWPLGMAVRI